MKTINVDADLTIKSFEGLTDWYAIVRAEHDGRNWLEKTEYGFSHMSSDRLIPNACIEGDSQELINIANAILSGKECYHKRCAVTKPINGRVSLYSPKNSLEYASVSKDVAKHWALEAIEKLQ